jgi:FKBP-type peptidyl-prolyl cis-trans isomerase FklB
MPVYIYSIDNGEQYMLQIKKVPVLISVALLLMSSASAYADEGKPKAVTLDDRSARIGYSLGYQIGGDFKGMGIEMDAEAVVKGIEDAMTGTEPLMPQKAMNGILMELKRKAVDSERKQLSQNRREMELKYIEEGKTFMQENAKKPGVKTTASGLQYKIIEPGTGKVPGPRDQVTVNYRGNLIDGQEFDSSYKRGEPATFNLGGVIKGWTEGLQLIKEGGKIQLFVPSELAYGDRGPLAHRTLIFDVELISIGDGKPASAAQGAQSQGKQ